MGYAAHKKKKATIPTMSKIYFGIATVIALWLILDSLGLI